MAVAGINHINIEVTAEQLPKVKAFYEDVLGLKPGFRAVSKRDGAWLYADNKAVIHLSVTEEWMDESDKIHFNHVAFACTGLAEFMSDFSKKDIKYTLEQRSLADREMTQIFLYDPVGIKIELNFAGETLS
ncbi:VOC family protein [Methyloglobulus sp.]|uniref:VOC family protein n=1 Tax=Methyloglobulus sp. TaxID=2518622 RepID=UPI00398A2B04